MTKILLVDDEESVLRALKRFLIRKGFEVEIAHCGQEALDNLDRIRPDVVVSDFKMPGMDGAQLLATVAHKLPSARRILLSGCADLPLGIDAVFLPKPWDDDELLRLCGKGSLP
jgi:DNA-binding NtrC family response regulator